MSASRSPVAYSPVVLNVGMDSQGYRFVTVAVAPGRVVTCTVVTVGITESDAIESALAHLSFMYQDGEVK